MLLPLPWLGGRQRGNPCMLTPWAGGKFPSSFTATSPQQKHVWPSHCSHPFCSRNHMQTSIRSSARPRAFHRQVRRHWLVLAASPQPLWKGKLPVSLAVVHSSTRSVLLLLPLPGGTTVARRVRFSPAAPEELKPLEEELSLTNVCALKSKQE